MKTRAEWIREVMDSADGLQPAPAPAGLEDRILQRMAAGRSVVRRLSPAVVWPVAAGIALLIAVNVFSMVHFSGHKQIAGSNTHPVTEEYFMNHNTMSF